MLGEGIEHKTGGYSKMREKKNILTYEGLRQLEDELHDLKVNKRKEVAQKIKEARDSNEIHSVEDFQQKTMLSKAVIETLQQNHVLLLFFHIQHLNELSFRFHLIIHYFFQLIV